MCALLSPASHAGQLSASAVPTILSVTETVNGGKPALTGDLSSVTNSGAVYSGTGTSRNLPNVDSVVGQLPPLTQQVYSTPDDATSAVSDIVQSNIGNIAQNVKSSLAAGALAGVAQVVFTYSVPVTITAAGGNNTQGQVNDTCYVAPSGQYSCIGAVYGANTEYTIFAVYSQGAVAQGLPANWTMPHAGQLQWAVLQIQGSGTSLSQNFIPEGGSIWHTDNLLNNGGPIGQYGQYDALQMANVNVSGVQKQALVNCAAASSGTCSQYQAGAYILDPNDSSGMGSIGFDSTLPVYALTTDKIVPLEQQYGANNAVILYGTTVKPVYNDVGGNTQTAEVAVDIQQRVVIPGKRYFFIANGGQTHFNETGTYGFMLDQRVDEYQVTKGQPVYVTSFDQHQVSPTKNFSKSVTLSNGQQVLSDTVINPFPTGNQIYSYLNDTVNHLPASAYVYVAPVVHQ